MHKDIFSGSQNGENLQHEEYGEGTGWHNESIKVLGAAPLYQKLTMEIKRQIGWGIYKAGDKLPTEREFCEMHQISRATVRRALIELEKQNVIISRQGSGIYVSPHIFQQSLQRFYSFSKEMRKKGKNPSNKLLSFRNIHGSAVICARMELQNKSPLIYIERLRLADDVIYFYETTYIYAKRMPGFSRELFENHDLYDVMTQQYQITLVQATESFRPILPSALVASYLKIKASSPCMLLRRSTRELSGEIIEYTESIGRGDKFEFQIELKNN